MRIKIKDKENLMKSLKNFENIKKMNFSKFKDFIQKENADLFFLIHYYFLKIRNFALEIISKNNNESSNTDNTNNSDEIFLATNNILEVISQNKKQNKYFKFVDDDDENSDEEEVEAIEIPIFKRKESFNLKYQFNTKSQSIGSKSNEGSTSNAPFIKKVPSINIIQPQEKNAEMDPFVKKLNHKKHLSVVNELKLFTQVNNSILSSINGEIPSIMQLSPKYSDKGSPLQISISSPLNKINPGSPLSPQNLKKYLSLNLDKNNLQNNEENETSSQYLLNRSPIFKKSSLNPNTRLGLQNILDLSMKLSKSNPNSPDKIHSPTSPTIFSNFSSGYLSKYNTTKTELRKFFFTFEKNKLIYYPNSSKKKPKGIIGLTRCFIKPDGKIKLSGRNFYVFNIYHNLNREILFCENKDEFDNWVRILKLATENEKKYNPVEFIGQGKFSVVHKGVDPTDSEEVAIKIMRKTKMEPVDLESTRREIAIMAICSHPNIMKMKTCYENYEYIYIIQEFFKNSTDLFTFVQNNNFDIPERDVKFIIRKVISVIEYIHDLGIVHRDIKPENILVNIEKSGIGEGINIKMIDFGLSKIVGQNELIKDEPYGTMAYAAPEVMLNQTYDKSVDLYGLGVLTYFLLSGKLPFDGKTEKEIRLYIHNNLTFSLALEGNLLFTSKKWNSISSDAIEFIRDLMQKDPNRRMDLSRIKKHKWVISS